MLRNTCDANTRQISTAGGSNAIQSRVLDAGYNGYYVSNLLSQQGTAALLRPLSGSLLEVQHNFIGAGAASIAIHGNSGTYGLYAEAYRRAAAERGVLRRDMQSITYEAVRGSLLRAPRRSRRTLTRPTRT